MSPHTGCPGIERQGNSRFPAGVSTATAERAPGVPRSETGPNIRPRSRCWPRTSQSLPTGGSRRGRSRAGGSLTMSAPGREARSPARPSGPGPLRLPRVSPAPRSHGGRCSPDPGPPGSAIYSDPGIARETRPAHEAEGRRWLPAHHERDRSLLSRAPAGRDPCTHREAACVIRDATESSGRRRGVRPRPASSPPFSSPGPS